MLVQMFVGGWWDVGLTGRLAVRREGGLIGSND